MERFFDVSVTDEGGAAYFANEPVLSGQIIHLRDGFALQRLRKNIYFRRNDSKWTNTIENDFADRLKNYPDSKLPMAR